MNKTADDNVEPTLNNVIKHNNSDRFIGGGDTCLSINIGCSLELLTPSI